MKGRLNLAQKGILIVALPLITQAAMYFVLKEQLRRGQQEAEILETSKRIVSEIDIAMIASSHLFESLVMACIEGDRHSEKELAVLTAAAQKRVTELTASLANEEHNQAEAQVIEKLSTQFFNQVKRSRESVATNQPLSIMLEFKASVRLRAAASAFLDELDKISQSEKNRQTGADEQVKRARDLFNHGLDLAVAMNGCLALILALFFVRGTVSSLAVLKENSRRLASGQSLLKQIDSDDEIAEVDKVFHEMALALEQAKQKERKLIESLQSSESRLKSVIDSAPAALIVTDAQGRIESLNPTAENLFGNTSKQLLGQNIAELLNIKAGESSPSFLARLIDETMTKPMAIEGLSSDKEIIPLELSVTNFETDSGQKILSTMIDVTERYKLELLKRDFVAMVSHDIRAPLTSMQALIGLVRTGSLGPISQEISEKLALAESNVSRLLQMVGKLLDLEKLDSGLAALLFTNFTVKGLFEASINLVAQEAKDKNLTIKTEGAAVSGYGDIDSLVQVLTNLLANAIRYSNPGGEVAVSAKEEEQAIVVSVRDHGPGIPEKKQKEVFERFKQSDIKRDKNSGFGLGLAICNAIIKQHGQEIGVDSEEGKGSTFWFTIARAEADSQLRESSG